MDDSALQHDILQLIVSISGKGLIEQIKYMLLHHNQKYCVTLSLKIIFVLYFYFIKFVFYLLYIIVTYSFVKRPLEENTKFSFLLYYVLRYLEF